MLDENFDGFEELTHEGKLRLYTRNGIFQARLYIGGRRYLTKSLKTRKLDNGRSYSVSNSLGEQKHGTRKAASFTQSETA